MSRLARANFKKYTDITNPLGSSQSIDKRKGGGGWLQAGGSDGDDKTGPDGPEKKGQGTADAEADVEDGDPFGLGKIMANDQKNVSTAERDNVGGGDEAEEEEEEDLFGLGRIMADDHEAAGSTGRESSGASGSATTARGGAKRANPDHPTGPAAGKAKKSQKATPGGYFSDFFVSSKARGSESSGGSATAAAAAESARNLPFIRSNFFKGARPGYVFHKGASGLGYYFDKVFAARAAREDMERRVGDRDGGGRVALPREDQPGKVAAVEALAAASATKVGGSKRPPVDVPVAAHKLEALLLKPKKAAKAALLMANLMDAEMRPENVAMFFRALKPLAEDPAGDAALASGEGAARAFRLLVDRGLEWLSSPSDRVRAVTWGLLFGLRHDVKTDDSFQFARAVKRLRQAIEALGDGVGRGGDSDADGGGKVTRPDATASLPLERKRAIVLIMKETFKSYHLAWARSSIESAFKAAADRRRLFPDGDLRETLDGFTDTITKRQRNPGGALVPPSRSVRAHNSTAHPTLNKRSDVIR